MKNWIICLATGVVCLCPLQAFSHEAHTHGGGEVNISIEGNRVTVELEIPFDSLIGFEHAIRTPEQKQLAADMLTILKEGNKMFRFTPTAKCTLNSVDFENDGMPKGSEEGEDGGHDDLEAKYVFTCAEPEKLASVEVGLFKGFRRLNKLEVKLAAPAGQREFKLNMVNAGAKW